MNKLVKRILGSVLAERRLAGENSNWTEVLGIVAATINTQHGRSSYDVSAYESVFGQSYDHDLSCSKEETRQCWTLDQRMGVTNDDADFVEYCKRIFILRDPEADNSVEENSANEEDDGYFSDGELPVDETSEVDDTYFYSHLHDDDVNEGNRKTPPENEFMLKSPVNLFSNENEELPDEDKRKLPANEDHIPEDKRKLPAKVAVAFCGDDITSVYDRSYAE
jgi:hypothetical protein